MGVDYNKKLDAVFKNPSNMTNDIANYLNCNTNSYFWENMLIAHPQLADWRDWSIAPLSKNLIDGFRSGLFNSHKIWMKLNNKDFERLKYYK